MSARPRPALLVLEDGAVFRGDACGAEGTVTGEVCFNTAMTGYQEVLTDPSYRGQIVAMTAAHIGNTGVNDADGQSQRPWLSGFVVRELSRSYSSWRAGSSLGRYLEDCGVCAMTEVDTRRLTRHLRSEGSMRGVLSTAAHEPARLAELARAAPSLSGRDLAREVTTSRRYGLPHVPGDTPSTSRGRARRVAAVDLGLKCSILDRLSAAGCDTTVVPAATPAAELLDDGFDGVVVSNGPGDPDAVVYAVSTVRRLLGRLPLFGICLGHQILALALGATTFKLLFGHHGANHPVRDLRTGRVHITAQNHGYAVAAESVRGTGASITEVNLNDGTVEGLEVPGVALGVQYHPEAGPGPHDAAGVFARFIDLMDGFEPRAPSSGERRIESSVTG